MPLAVSSTSTARNPTHVYAAKAIPYDLGLLIPAILLSWFAGNHFGAFAARIAFRELPRLARVIEIVEERNDHERRGT